MSTPATLSLPLASAQEKANLARIRDNQRRSRARRREYIRELEQRLRTFELQGVEASAEVQLAARRVAEENRQLRDLLNRHGFGDDYIARYLLQVSAVAPPSDTGAPRFSVGDAGSLVQSLQQLIAPRRPVGLDPGVQFALPGQVGREMSTTSASSGSSTAWDPQHAVTMPPYGHQSTIAVGPASIAPQTGVTPLSYSSPVFADGTASSSGTNGIPTMPSPESLLQDLTPKGETTQTMNGEHHETMGYNVPISPFQMPTHGGFTLGPFF